jgi:hypothetical protein
MRGFVTALASVFVLAAASPERPAPAEFSLTIEGISTGWHIRCAKGCTWTDVSHVCRTACRSLVHEMGQTTEVDAPLQTDGFAFVLKRTESGWSARSRKGTSWSSLTWGCAVEPCPAIVTESGVRKP